MITFLLNAAIRFRDVPEIRLLPKLGKSPSLLPIISKQFEKLLFKWLKLLIEEKSLIPEY